MKVRKPSKDRKLEIVQTALALAFETGHERVTTGMIAERLGLSQPAIYKHFPRKDDIWLAVELTLRAQIKANITGASDPSLAPLVRLRLLVMGHLNLVYKTPALPEIMVARNPRDMQATPKTTPQTTPQTSVQTSVQTGIQISMSEFFIVLTRTVEEAQDNGFFRSDIPTKDLAALIFGVIQSLVLRMLVNRDPNILLADGKRLLDLQLSAFARQGDEL